MNDPQTTKECPECNGKGQIELFDSENIEVYLVDCEYCLGSGEVSNHEFINYWKDEEFDRDFDEYEEEY